MRYTVRAHHAGAIHRETNGQILNHNIMNNGIIGTLKKGREDRGKRLEPFRRQTSGKRLGMLFGNAHVETPVGISSAK